MKTLGRYDGTMQMFVEAPRAPKIEQLRFLRWLAERNGLEHPVAGRPTGQDARAGRPEAGDAPTPDDTALPAPPVLSPTGHRRDHDRGSIPETEIVPE